MSFFRSYIAPLLIVLIFAVAMLAVSARIFLPSDMMAPAPIEEQLSTTDSMPTATLDLDMPNLSELLHGPAGYAAEG
ncbi:hypothetical protein IQ254_03770 [Nodosilinea sp. LEGE 07088]|uniref:hypothetical protein n=1 Tax=Nodosilinea sp. LEGE 07088 TaxID=2777968 RepID=UPI0018803F84|nr:hypothetical protein [Nodosilinea sp. LEGE 07088]MBE9136328.1 hypothetical protein [Nodosilinea sp. LEGE 07088]